MNDNRSPESSECLARRSDTTVTFYRFDWKRRIFFEITLRRIVFEESRALGRQQLQNTRESCGAVRARTSLINPRRVSTVMVSSNDGLRKFAANRIWKTFDYREHKPSMAPWGRFYPIPQKRTFYLPYSNDAGSTKGAFRSSLKYLTSRFGEVSWKNVISGFKVGINLRSQIVNLK